MALNKIWVSAVGNDSNSGTNFGEAKLTIDGGLAALTAAAGAKNNVLNVVNNGTYLMSDNTEYQGTSELDVTDGFTGTSYSGTDFGFIIQGVNTTGVAAMVTVAATQTRRYGMMRLRGGLTTPMKYGTIQGFIFDFSDVVTHLGTLNCIHRIRTACMPLRILDCEVVGMTYNGTTPDGKRLLLGDLTITPQAASVEGLELAYNVLINASNGLHHLDGTKHIVNMHHNVAIWSTDDTTSFNVLALGSISSGVYLDYSLTHNTLYVDHQFAAEGSGQLITLATTNGTNVNVNSNLLYVQPASGVSDSNPLPGGLIVGGIGSNGTTGTMGYNYFALGTNVSQLSSWTSGGFYDDSYQHPDWPSVTSGTFTTTYTTDTVVTNVAPTAVFNSITEAYTWLDPSSNGYNHTLPIDLRPIVGKASGLGGTTMGALPAFVELVTSTESDTDVTNVFIDSLPFYRPIIKANTVTMVRVRRNGVAGHIDLRHYLSDHIHNESTHRVAKIEAAATATLSFAGVATARGVAILTDTEVQATFSLSGGGSFVAIIDEAASYDGAQFTTVSVSNTSSTTATVQVVAFD